MSKRQMNKSVSKQKGEIKVNHVIFVLDRSGSMERVRQSTLDNLNEQIQQMKADCPGDQATFVTVMSFSRTINVMRCRESLSKIKPIKMSEYQPYGNTALYDAIGRSIGMATDYMSEYRNFDNASLIFILTDGKDNASEEFVMKSDIRELIEEKKKDGRFTFAFMGCSEEILNDATLIGLTSTIKYDASSKGLEALRWANVNATSNYFTARDQGLTSVNEFYE